MSHKEDLLNIGNGNNSNNMKKILIYVAIAFLIFVIGVIGFAIVQNNKSEKEAIIPPESNQPKQENLFKQIPIEDDNQQNVNNQQNKQSINEQQNEQQNEQTQNKQPQNIKQSKNKQPQNVASIQLQNEVDTTLNKTETTEVKKSKVKKEVVKKIAQPVKKVTKIKYYVQVAALLRYKKPSKRFLQLITKNGYKYKFFVTYTKIKNEKVRVTKVLVGPFRNEKAARAAMRKIKANITQNAFIFKVK